MVKSMDDNCGEWVECMGVASGCGEQEAGVARLNVWMTIVESGWNVWVWLVGVVSRRQVWLVGEGGIYGCGCKEV